MSCPRRWYVHFVRDVSTPEEPIPTAAGSTSSTGCNESAERSVGVCRYLLGRQGVLTKVVGFFGYDLYKGGFGFDTVPGLVWGC